MYKRKIPLEKNCGITIALEVVLSKWKYYILVKIAEGITRPKDLVSAIPGLTKRVMHQQLKDLEFYKMVEKKVYPEIPPKVDYSLTERAEKVLPILADVNDWGLSFVPDFTEIVGNKGCEASGE